MNRTFSLVALLAAVILLCALPVAAQITGDIRVTTADQSGAVVPGAKVTIIHKETCVSRSAAADAFGSVRFSQLSIGTYDVRVEAQGFSTYSSTAVVNSGAITTVPIVLEVKGTTQEVVVVESSVQLNTVNSQLQSTTAAEKIVSLPIAQGGVLALAGTAPGVIPVTPRNPFLGLGSFNSNGGRGRGNNITLDNATATDVSTTGAAGLGTVPLDAIKEFNLITNNFNAEFGRNSSAQVQILTKSGANDFHGSLFEFFRNDVLNARDYFDRTGKASILRDNDWGATGGGRMVRNRLFWFGTYEQRKIRGAGSTRIATVPRPDQVNAQTDATSRKLLEQLKVPLSPTGTVGNPAPNLTDSLAFSGRADANITDKDIVTFRYGIQDSRVKNPGLTFISSNLPTNGASSVNRPQNATATYTRTISPSTVNQVLASFGRSRPGFAPLETFGASEIGFTDGTSNFGIWNGVPQGRVQNTYQLMDTITHNYGKHLLKFGADVNRVQSNSYFDANVRGTLTFLTLADFLAGRPFQYAQRFGNSVRGNRVWNTFLFAQDDFHVSRNLTLNFGLRLEVNGGVTEVNNVLSNLDLNKKEPLGGGGTGPLGAFYTGGTYFDRTWNWGPRFGFSWNPDNGKMAIRGGYGISYDFIFLNPITNGRFLPPYMYQFTLPNTDITGANGYAALVAGNSQFQQQGAAAVGTFPGNVKNFGAISPIDRGLDNPQVQQFSLTVERELPWQLLGRVSYSGAKGNYLQRSRPINTIAPGVFTPPQTPEEEARRQQSGEFTRINAGLNAALTASSNRIDPRFNGVTLVESSANSIFQSVQFYAQRRFVRGYSFSAAYTVGKSIDDVSDVLGVLATDTPSQQNPFDNRNNRAVSQFDIPQRVAVTHNFEPRVNHSNRALKFILDGWIFSGIFQAQSGFPQNLASGARAGLADPTLVGGGGAVRPNLAGPLNIPWEANPGLGARNPNKVPSAGLAQPLVGNFGTIGRNVIRLNPLVQADMNFGKRFRITERIRAEFQTQIFNIFNNTTFSRPGASLAAPATFGYYADTDTDSRNMTMVLRLVW
ncbi:MAG: TonB-dependent receptor [Acidobacteria bacterium]|nr:TonB-dependent receptor [Acidobacteriota bacterium]